MMKIYGSKRSRALRVMVLLEELGVDYEHVNLDTSIEEHKTDQYLKIHPLGQMPALQDGDLTMFESVGICLYLSDKFIDKGFAPAFDSPERGLYYQWAAYIGGSFEPAIMAAFAAKEQGEEALEGAKSKLAQVVGVIADAIEGKSYLVGDCYSTADLLIASTLAWISMMGVFPLDGHLAEYVGRIGQRDAFKKVMMG